MIAGSRLHRLTAAVKCGGRQSEKLLTFYDLVSAGAQDPGSVVHDLVIVTDNVGGFWIDAVRLLHEAAVRL